MAGHTEGLRKGQFCSVRAETCECGNKYRKPCDVTAAKWDADPRAAKRKLSHKVSQYAQKMRDGAQLRGHEAHHIACVAAVSAIITSNFDIEPVVKQTKWCINAAGNMIALPMWAHTISWYVNLFDASFVVADAPPFAGLTQHDYDHAKYIEEVDKDLRDIVRSVNKAKDAHKDPSGTLVGGLQSVIAKHKRRLRGRDTHASWQHGMRYPQGGWYKAFSMCQRPSPRAFPASENRMGKKIAGVRNAFLKFFA